MKVLILPVVLFSVSAAFAQAPKSAPATAPKPQITAPAKSRALLAAETQISEQEAEIEKLKADQAQSTAELTKFQLQAEYNKSLLKILSKEIAGIPLTPEDGKSINADPADPEAFDLALGIEKNVNQGVALIGKLVEESGKVTDRYNSLLADYKDYITRSELRQQALAQQLGIQAQQAQIANSLALYNSMPRYTPPQQINMNVTLSDCTRLPALCSNGPDIARGVYRPTR